jgi:hypothetical protein
MVKQSDDVFIRFSTRKTQGILKWHSGEERNDVKADRV